MNHAIMPATFLAKSLMKSIFDMCSCIPECDSNGDVLAELQIEGEDVLLLVVVQWKMYLVFELDTFLA